MIRAHLSLRPAAALVTAAAFAASLSGCLLDASAYDSAGAGAGSGTTKTTVGGAAQGGSGTGNGGSGASGAAGGATSSGGATSAGGTTTTTAATDCTKDGDCPDPGGLCVAAKCDKGLCTGKPDNDKAVCGIAMGECYDLAKCDAMECKSLPLPNDSPLPSFPDDCKKRVCNGAGTAVDKPDPDDHQPSDECMERSCNGDSLVETPIHIGGTCLFNTGVCCAGVCCVAAAGCCANSGVCNYGICL